MKEKSSKLIPIKFAFSAAVIASITTFLITILALIFPNSTSAAEILLIIYQNLGYSISTLGSLIGAFYIFIDTFIVIWIFAWLYNKIS